MSFWFRAGLAAALVLLAGTPGASAAPAGWGLPSLMQGLAQVRAAGARFTERKTIHILTTPLIASGTLDYVAPDYLRKTTTSPVPENFVLDHGQVAMTGPDQQTHVFAIAEDPQIGGLVEGIRATLAGDLPALERLYTVQLSGTAAAWRLLLRPKDADVARVVTWMLIEGQANRITTIDTGGGNGDHSEMGIVEAAGDGP